MALRDYVRCAKCDKKMLYDGDDMIRDEMESQFDLADFYCEDHWEEGMQAGASSGYRIVMVVVAPDVEDS